MCLKIQGQKFYYLSEIREKKIFFAKNCWCQKIKGVPILRGITVLYQTSNATLKTCNPTHIPEISRLQRKKILNIYHTSPENKFLELSKIKEAEHESKMEFLP